HGNGVRADQPFHHVRAGTRQLHSDAALGRRCEADRIACPITRRKTQTTEQNHGGAASPFLPNPIVSHATSWCDHPCTARPGAVPRTGPREVPILQNLYHTGYFSPPVLPVGHAPTGSLFQLSAGCCAGDRFSNDGFCCRSVWP